MRKLILLLSMISLVACARGDNNAFKVGIGMKVKDFQNQQFVKENFNPLSQDSPSFSSTDIPHVLNVNFNGKLVSFKTGGMGYATFVSSSLAGPYERGSAYIDSISFDMSRTRLSLSEAVKIAREKCEEVIAAGFRVQTLINETPVDITFKQKPSQAKAISAGELISYSSDKDHTLTSANICTLKGSGSTFFAGILASQGRAGESTFYHANGSLLKDVKM